MSKRPFVIFGTLAVICLVVLPFWALDQVGSSDAAPEGSVPASDQQGLELFQINCGACHTLAAAGTDGVVGPDLDERFAPSGTNSAQSFEGNASTVMLAVRCGIGGRMPQGILEEPEAQQAAVFVAAYAGQIGKGPVVDTADVKPPGPPTC
jgi:mono/diheme cytochrome c family protein